MYTSRLLRLLLVAALGSLIAIPPSYAAQTMPRARQPLAGPADVSRVRESAPAASGSAGERLRRQPAEAPDGRTLVKVPPKRSVRSLQAAGPRLGLRVVESIPEIGWAVIEPVRASDTAAAVTSRARRAGYVWRTATETWVTASQRPSDPRFSEQWGFENTGQTGGTAGADANAVFAWDWSRGDDVVVAVTDTGVDFSHPDLAGQKWSNPGEIAGNGVDDDGNGKVDDVNGWDFYHSDSSVYDPADGDKHGTHVAGTIAAAASNAEGGSGTAPGATILSAKFLGPMGGTDANGAAAIVYAVNEGADIINASWGGGASSTVLQDALAYAASHDVLVVCAAGNSGVDTDDYPDYPASYPATNVVSVAALTDTDEVAWFSNVGAQSVDLGAPGEDILSSQPKLAATLVIDDSPSRIVYHAFPVEKVTDAGAREEIIAMSMARLDAPAGTPVMVVDDSWPNVGAETPGSRSSAYVSALESDGYSVSSVWRTDVSGTPSASAMAGKAVVWFTGASSYYIGGYSTYGTLSSAERSAISAYLDAGGYLLLSSGDLGYDMTRIGGTALTFYRNYLHARYLDDDPWTGTLHTTSDWSGTTAVVDDPMRYLDGCDCVGAYDSSAQVRATWDEYATISGTSMAAPHVAGALALMRARFADTPSAELKSRLLSTVRPVPALAGNTVTGGTLDIAAAVGELGAPSDFVAVPDTRSVRLSWTNSGDSDFAATRVLARTGSAPAGPDDSQATLVYEGAASSFVHADLEPGTRVFYAAFSANDLGSWSEGSLADATPLPPMAVDDSYDVLWNRTTSVPAPGVLANDTGATGAAVLVSDAENGDVTLSADGSFVYRPNPGFFGADIFTYEVSDATRTERATVTLDVTRFRVDSLSATKATPGTAVTFTGTGFGETQGDAGYVTFAGTRATVVEWSDTQVVVLVPPGAKPGYAGVGQHGIVSNGIWFTPAPRVSAMTPTTAQPGQLVTFSGTGFGALQGTGYVTFGKTIGIVVSWSDTEVVAMVPAGVVSGYAGVCQNGVMSNGVWFYGARPTLDSVSPGNGGFGSTVTFVGSDFGTNQGIGYVSFAGARAQIVSWTDTQVVATVPEGAMPGYAGVCQNGAMSNGKYFIPYATPHVETLSSNYAAPGSLITLEGTGFGATQGSGWVTFGGVKATVVSWTDTSVTAVVPLITGPCYAGVVQNGVCSNGKYFIPDL